MAAVNLIGSYNYALVALSVLIAMFASYAALDLAGRVTAARGWTRAVWLLGGAGAMGTGIRSEEHTSELQSRLHLVCRLLLEKKKYDALSTHPFRRLQHN